MLMNYLNDFAQTGMDNKDLKLIWPSIEQTIQRIDRKLPKWTRMLHDGQATCCFAVAVDDCLVYSGDGHRLCRNSEHHRRGRAVQSAQTDLFSTTINLHEDPAVDLPLAPDDFLRLDSGRLSISGGHRKGCARLAAFWTPGVVESVVDKARELIGAPGSQRSGSRIHAELLDLRRSTGLCLDVCIRDR